MELQNDKTETELRGASTLMRGLGPRRILYRQPIYTSNGTFLRWHQWGLYLDGRFEAPSAPQNGRDTRAESQQFVYEYDMNEKPIFEGDIIRYWINESNYDLMLIIFDDLAFRAVADDKIPVGVPNKSCIEVVGNIVENPDMLPWA